MACMETQLVRIITTSGGHGATVAPEDHYIATWDSLTRDVVMD